MDTGSQLRELHLTLMRGRTWRYLRYLHLREYFAHAVQEVGSVAICGAGHGIAELALAIEYPKVHFTLTDIVAPGYPNYHAAMALAWNWEIHNIAFSVWNVLAKTPRRFDMVCSTEMLEHLPEADARRAASNMCEAALKFVYCLVPFADAATNSNAARRSRAMEFGHFVCGYDAETLRSLFGPPALIAGTYWSGEGSVWRERVTRMSNDEIGCDFENLAATAKRDLIDAVPQNSTEAQGIKVLVETD